LFGVLEWQCACPPHPLDENNTAILLVLERLERVDLDRAYFQRVMDEKTSKDAAHAAQSFPLAAQDDDVRAWWSSVRDR
jgi:hypothetical protein